TCGHGSWVGVSPCSFLRGGDSRRHLPRVSVSPPSVHTCTRALGGSLRARPGAVNWTKVGPRWLRRRAARGRVRSAPPAPDGLGAGVAARPGPEEARGVRGAGGAGAGGDVTSRGREGGRAKRS